MTEQLELFAATEAEPTPTPVTMVGCCQYGCGTHTRVTQDDVGAPWMGSIMWALLPIGTHERFCLLNPNREHGPANPSADPAAS